jgi:hypothetical protein
MLKRKSLAVPVRDLKDLKNFQGFGDFSEEEERAFLAAHLIIMMRTVPTHELI